MMEINEETIKAVSAGPIDAIFARKGDILAMKYEEIEKIAKVLDSVGWCGGLGCGHGAITRRIPERIPEGSL